MASQACTFKLVMTDESGGNIVTQDVTGGGWTHAANTLFNEFTISGTSLTGLSGKHIHIGNTGGSTDASGYTATLIWKRA